MIARRRVRLWTMERIDPPHDQHLAKEPEVVDVMVEYSRLSAVAKQESDSNTSCLGYLRARAGRYGDVNMMSSLRPQWHDSLEGQ